MSVRIINPKTGQDLVRDGESLVDEDGNRFPVTAGVPRLCEAENYASNFGKQWNIFRETQLDATQSMPGPSERRLFAETAWEPADLAGLDVLEVGSGAGRFSRVILSRTEANLYSIDYSSAVEANLANNGDIAPERFQLFQASIYEMPFPDDSFDKVFCMGVLQHTPDFEESVRSLVSKAKPGGEIVVDFYPVRGWWTKIHGKYILRPFTRRMDQQRLYRLVKQNTGWMLRVSQTLDRIGLHVLTRFVPIPDLSIMPKDLTREQLREWVELDTFDMLSPEYDNPQRIKTVAQMFDRAGATVTFAGYVDNGNGHAAVVRAVKGKGQAGAGTPGQ